MAWETRGNREYYYQKRKINGRCQSVYIGTGPFVQLAANWDRIERERREAKRLRWKAEREADLEIDRVLTEYGRAVNDVVSAVLLAGGCYRHKRQWRKRRIQKLSL